MDEPKKSGRLGAIVAWIAGSLGATLVFLGSVPPAQAIANLAAWADALGMRLESRGNPCPAANLCFSDREIGLLEAMVLWGIALLMLAAYIGWRSFQSQREARSHA